MPGRPREFDRDEALARARDLFWERGYEGTSLSDLVEALGIASARIYAAFGSKESLFREAVELYEREEGGFATRALEEEATVRSALERIFHDAIALYTRPGRPRGCMVVSAATNCSSDNAEIGRWLSEHRRQRTSAIIGRLKRAVAEGELPRKTDAAALGDYYATFLHGISVQARDGVSKQRLLQTVPLALALLASLSRVTTPPRTVTIRNDEGAAPMVGISRSLERRPAK